MNFDLQSNVMQSEVQNDPSSERLSDELTVFDEFDSASKMSAAMAAMADDTVAETVYALIGEVRTFTQFCILDLDFIKL